MPVLGGGGGGGGAVATVNGHIGNVVLTAADVGAATPADLALPRTLSKSAAMIFGGQGGGANTSQTDMHMRLLWTPRATTTRWRLRHKNAATLACTGMYVGQAAFNASDGTPSGATVATPTQYLPSYSISGGEYVSGWVTDPAKQFTADQPTILSFGLSTGGAAVNFDGHTFGCFFRLNASTESTQATPATGVQYNSNGYTVVIIEFDCTVNEGAAVGLWLGDSIGEGRGTNMHPYSELYAARTGSISMNNSKGGARATDFGATGTRWDVLDFTTKTIDFCVIALGSNNAFDSMTLANFQTAIKAIIDKVRTVSGKPNLPIYFVNIAPRGYTGTEETLRVAYNAWLRTLPFGTVGCFDADLALEDDTDPTVLDARWVGDGTHYTIEGHRRVAQIIGGRLHRANVL